MELTLDELRTISANQLTQNEIMLLVLHRKYTTREIGVMMDKSFQEIARLIKRAEGKIEGQRTQRVT